ncbi:nucleotidyltransferase family protein [Rhodoferax sp.]|uniref:nucleotidyltransferase family protein n=1 Tax=Rhodoferax sp. TaxID=50421 RepID=UPI00277A44ED|nr:nucleotidyltransferase family protein [Rhodoferax sp.]
MTHDPRQPVAPERFVADVLRNRFNRAIVERLDDLKLPDAWLVAGCLFQTVWNLRWGQPAEAGIRDYDIFYFDGHDLSKHAEAAVSERAAALFADLGVPIEIKNQARVHLWYEDYFGQPYAALRSAREGIDRFLVGCTAVGIRPHTAGPRSSHTVYAPYGLQDLYRGVLTRNRSMDHGPLFERKCRDYQLRWPGLTWEADLST